MLYRIPSVFRGLCMRSEPLLGSSSFHNWKAATSNVAHISQTQNDASIKAKQDYNSELLRRLSALRLSVDATRCSERQHQNRYLTTCSKIPHNKMQTISSHAHAPLSSNLLLGQSGVTNTCQTVQQRSAHMLKIRRWKMNRHRYIRVKKKNRTNLLKQFYLSRRKRLARYNAAAAAVREDGDNFDALEFVKSRIAIAKKGGFKHDIWRSPDDQPETPWLKYEMPDKKKCRTYERSKPVPSVVHPKKLKLQLEKSTNQGLKPKFDFLPKLPGQTRIPKWKRGVKLF